MSHVHIKKNSDTVSFFGKISVTYEFVWVEMPRTPHQKNCFVEIYFRDKKFPDRYGLLVFDILQQWNENNLETRGCKQLAAASQLVILGAYNSSIS